MLDKISTFFNTLLAHEPNEKNAELSLEIACAVLLCEVMRADSVFTEAEQAQLSAILTTQFALDAQEVSAILAQAFELSDNANDFYQFTSKLNQHYSLDERIKIVTLLWQVAYSEIFFEKKLWPDFNEKDYYKIIKKYKNIKRNFGNI
mgnify:CR=1 FL=1